MSVISISLKVRCRLNACAYTSKSWPGGMPLSDKTKNSSRSRQEYGTDGPSGKQYSQNEGRDINGGGGICRRLLFIWSKPGLRRHAGAAFSI
jgi:hypothetical protein